MCELFERMAVQQDEKVAAMASGQESSGLSNRDVEVWLFTCSEIFFLSKISNGFRCLPRQGLQPAARSVNSSLTAVEKVDRSPARELGTVAAEEVLLAVALPHD